jgi:uncharacterized protein YbbK (DUF523 family)
LRLGISACLLGHPVRWDGRHKRDATLVDVIGPIVEWVAVCPEVEIGLGIPRDPIRIVGDRLVVDRTGEDLTDRMRRYARDRVRELRHLDLNGYVLKSRSPSCGLFEVRGLFAAVLTELMPDLPVEEEGRLADPALRQRFLARCRIAAP